MNGSTDAALGDLVFGLCCGGPAVLLFVAVLVVLAPRAHKRVQARVAH